MKLHASFVIVGAGLAGSTCAYLMQRAGYDVLLLERKDISKKSKLCAGLVTPRALKELYAVFPLIPDSLFRMSFDSMCCIADRHVVDVTGISMKSVERAELDAYALEQYVSHGGRVIDEVRALSYEFDQHELVIRTGRGEAITISYDTLIAADGALSTTRKNLTGALPESILSLEAIAPYNGSPLVMSYEDGFFGYSWYAPVGERSKIGCCAYAGSPDLKLELERFASRIDVKYEGLRGAFIPTGSDVLLERDGVYFIGDAASLICPPSGEGIFYAVFSAHMLARSFIGGIDYNRSMSSQVRLIRRQFAMRNLFFNARFMDMGLDVARVTPYGCERAVKFALKHFTGFSAH